MPRVLETASIGAICALARTQLRHPVWCHAGGKWFTIRGSVEREQRPGKIAWETRKAITSAVERSSDFVESDVTKSMETQLTVRVAPLVCLYLCGMQ